MVIVPKRRPSAFGSCWDGRESQFCCLTFHCPIAAVAHFDEQFLIAHPRQIASGDADRCECPVRTSPLSRAKATARSLSVGFGPPARRRASARSRSRLRCFGKWGALGRRRIANSYFLVSSTPASQLRLFYSPTRQDNRNQCGRGRPRYRVASGPDIAGERPLTGEHGLSRNLAAPYLISEINYTTLDYLYNI
ncbi:hypothetical protein V1277_006560 [Bradyrhizobium sp. AZCC 1588]